ncbi:MAG: isoprenylcysteine carboxylmethyltransferase family protein [Deltaproteobacteria bacterium]|nr:isoprenylcysteine carboxylmethyltransferase family protein [Deltaproteobacteria bacterium]
MRQKRFLPPTYIFISIVFMLLLYFLFPVVTIVPFPWNLLGAIPLVVGVFINLVADEVFKKRDTTVKPFEKSNVLITDGVFQITRHPMYLGMVFILAGIAVLLGELSPFVVVPVFAYLMDVVFITVEEQMLEEQFPHVWGEYKKKVRRWI